MLQAAGPVPESVEEKFHTTLTLSEAAPMSQ